MKKNVTKKCSKCQKWRPISWYKSLKAGIELTDTCSYCRDKSSACRAKRQELYKTENGTSDLSKMLEEIHEKLMQATADEWPIIAREYSIIAYKIQHEKAMKSKYSQADAVTRVVNTGIIDYNDF